MNPFPQYLLGPICCSLARAVSSVRGTLSYRYLINAIVPQLLPMSTPEQHQAAPLPAGAFLVIDGASVSPLQAAEHLVVKTLLRTFDV